MSRIHGIALANSLGTGFISDGGGNEVVVFNLKDLSVQKKIKAGMNPDGTKNKFTRAYAIWHASLKPAANSDYGSEPAEMLDVARRIMEGKKPEAPAH